MRIEILPILITRPNASSMRNVIQFKMLRPSLKLCDIHYGEHSRRLSGTTQNGREIRQRAQYEIPILTELMGKHYYYTYSATIQPPLTAHSSMKVHPRTCHECPERERVDVQLISFFNFGAQWGCEVVTLRPLYTRVRPITHSIEG